jgi:hypothetical protein
MKMGSGGGVEVCPDWTLTVTTRRDTIWSKYVLTIIDPPRCVNVPQVWMPRGNDREEMMESRDDGWAFIEK